MKKTFGKDFRLSRSKDFQSIFKNGRIFKHAYCKVYLHPGTQAKSRLGVIVAKRTVPLSTQRHQFKRIIRESFRLSSERLSGYAIIVMLRQRPQSNAELWAALECIWQKINRWRNALSVK